jgi:hypothetical protein
MGVWEVWLMDINPAKHPAMAPLWHPHQWFLKSPKKLAAEMARQPHYTARVAVESAILEYPQTNHHHHYRPKMDIRLLKPSDIPHVQHANITNLPEKYDLPET